MSDQKVGRQIGDVLMGWAAWGVKWGAVVVGLRMLDVYVMGGRSGVLGVVRGWGGGLG